MMRYRICHAYFQSGQGKKALDLAEAILAENQPEGEAKWLTLYMKAFLTGRVRQYESALEQWWYLVAHCPNPDILAPAYKELARVYSFTGRDTDAIDVYLELEIRLPHRIEARQAALSIDSILRTNAELQATFPAQQTAALSRWKSKYLYGSPPERDAVAKKAGSDRPSTGGAE